MRLKSKKIPKKPDIWITEIRVKDKNVSRALRDLIRLVRGYEDLP